MVVLIVGISLGGYVAYKFFGARAGSAASRGHHRRVGFEHRRQPLATRDEACCLGGRASSFGCVCNDDGLLHFHSGARVLVEIAAAGARPIWSHCAATRPGSVRALPPGCGGALPAQPKAGRSGCRSGKIPQSSEPAPVFGGLYALVLAGGRCRRAAFWI